MPLARFMHACLIVVCLAAVLLFSSCSGKPERSDKPSIACTIFPLASIVQQIVGPHAQVHTLVPTGVSPHGFEPTGKQITAMRSAWAIVSVGLGYDEWAHTTAERENIPVIEMGDDVSLPKSATGPGQTPSEHGHTHRVANPHIWVDPVLMTEFVGELTPRLVQIIGHKDELEANAAKLTAALKALDAEFRAKLDRFRGAKLVTYHNAFDLLAERYGLVVAATLTPIDSPAGMTPRKLEEAIAVIKQFGVKTIYAEPQFPNEVSSVVRQETGVRVLTLDCLGDPASTDRASYQQILRYDVAQILDGLR
jgi:zinc transport system substrate-binding protein/manganese/iron transport system substrate-binding protein